MPRRAGRVDPALTYPHPMDWSPDAWRNRRRLFFALIHGLETGAWDIPGLTALHAALAVVDPEHTLPHDQALTRIGLYDRASQAILSLKVPRTHKYLAANLREWAQTHWPDAWRSPHKTLHTCYPCLPPISDADSP